MRTDSWQSADTRPSKWLLCAGVSVCASVLTYWPQGLSCFRYDRAALAAGQLWRLVSAHLVHLNTPHLLLNVLGLFLICELLWGELPLKHGSGLLLSSAVGVSGLLWWLQPELAWYAGLSGVLHGLWAGCALAAWWRPHAPGLEREKSLPSAWRQAAAARWPVSRVAGSAGFVLLLAKLAIEWRYGASARVTQAIGAPVVAPAHFYGAVTGSAYLLVCKLVLAWRRKK